MRTYSFPPGFLWGTATSAHQTEGNNTYSDWWTWEQSKFSDNEYPLEPSGIACDAYNRYPEDLDLALKLNNNAVRLSIEWARLQPAPDEFDPAEIQHYREVLRVARQRNLKTFVTLHHFTNPLWLAQKGGWLNPRAVVYFTNYAARCVNELADLVDAFITINEPQVYAYMAYTIGLWPPNKRNPLASFLVQANLIRAHRRAYSAIKEKINTPVGIAKNIVWYEVNPYRSCFYDRWAARLLNWLNDDFLLRPLMGRLDFLGLNYYFTNRIRNLRTNNPTDYISDMGWWINPGGLGKILKKLGKYQLPIYITENGLADSWDKLREHFLRDMILACGMAINNEGVDLRGYFHWSLIDNYEWHLGFAPRFGLVEIDREDNLKRKPRPSFDYYAKICRENKIVVE